MVLKTARVRLNEYSMDAWALFRAMMRRASFEKVYGHQSDAEAGSHERSPPK